MKDSTKLVQLEDFIDKNIGKVGSERRTSFEKGYNTFKREKFTEDLSKE